MSLPDAPNTLREKYYSVMAGQNDADILPDIETAPSTENRYLDYIARNGGGGGGAVNSVNGQTGDVVLTASDVDALPDNTSIPSKTSDLTNDSNFVSDESYVHTDNNYTAAEKTKLDTVETNATANTVINTSCTLAANEWTGASAPYTQTVNVASIQSTDHASVDLSVSSTTATGIDEIENWAYISKVESGTGTLTFTCYEDKPDIDLNVNVQVVRGTNSGTNLPVLKSITWTGTGTATNSITFTEKPTLVISIQLTNKDPLNAACMPFRYGSPSMFCVYTNSQAPGKWQGTYTSRLTYSADELTMTFTGTDKGSAWNDETTNYTLYYI